MDWTYTTVGLWTPTTRTVTWFIDSEPKIFQMYLSMMPDFNVLFETRKHSLDSYIQA
jgi:hypothetical protein